MSAVLECLFIDDNARDLKDFAIYLREAWEELGTGVSLHVTPRSSQQEGLREILDNGSSYRLFVLDLLYKDSSRGEEKPGYVPLFEAARKVPRSVRVALTAERRPGHRPRVEELGGAAYIVKDDVVAGGGIKYLAKELRRLRPRLISLDETLGRKLTVADEIDLLAITESVGRGELISLLEDILSRPVKSAVASYVAPGFSGAVVLRVDCIHEDDEGRAVNRQLLLKVSRDRGRLLEEVERAAFAKQMPESRVIRLETDRVAESGGWSAIALGFKARAETLHSWLRRPQGRTEIVRCLEQLLLEDGLGQMYRRLEVLSDVRPNVAIWRCLTLSRRARIRQALEEIWPLLVAHWPTGANRSLIDQFLSEARRIGELDEETFPMGTRFCWSHGDLHSRNILIDKASNPQVIDFANCHQMPWPMDIARLTADLLLSTLDYGVQSHEWSRLTSWYEVGRAVTNGTLQLGITSGVAGSDSVAIALEWMQGNRSEVFGGITAEDGWQLSLALAVEYLRATYRSDLSAPKRVLAAVLAADALSNAEDKRRSVVRP